MNGLIITHFLLVVIAAAAFIVMPILSFYLKLHDSMIGILSTCSKITSLLITSISWNGKKAEKSKVLE